VKIVIDPDKCQGHTLCAAAAPKIFGLREEDGHAYVMAEDIPPELEPSALRALPVSVGSE
jgi:ferredoxin